MHERQSIRQAIKAQLLGVTVAGTRVLETRMIPLPTAQLPAISIYTDSESVEPASKTTAPRELTRTVRVSIAAWVIAAADVDDAMDAIALEIETAMDSNLELAGTAYSSILTGTQADIETTGARPMGCVQLTFDVVYHTDLRVLISDATAANFNTADIRFNPVPGVNAVNQAHDLIQNIHQ